MSDIIFVKPRHDYGSYCDWWTLAQLAGYPIVYEDEIDITNPAHCYIFTWFGAQSPFAEDAKARLICWNLEWADVPILPNVEYWSADKWYADAHGWQYVPVGSDTRLAGDFSSSFQPDLYDITLQMYRDVYRRRAIIQQIHERGLTIAPDGWNEARHHALLQSRCQVHIHQRDEAHAVSPLRFAVAAAYRLPIITERLNSAGAYHGVVIQASYDGLPDAVTEWLQPARRGHLLRFGEALYQRLCIDLPFKKVVESSV